MASFFGLGSATTAQLRRPCSPWRAGGLGEHCRPGAKPPRLQSMPTLVVGALLGAAAAAAPRGFVRRRRAVGVCWAAAGSVDAEAARKLLDGPHTVLDIRTEKEWDAGHITKPPRCAANVPFAAGQEAVRFVQQVSSKFPSKAAKLLVMCASGGEDSAEAVEALLSAGYTDVALVEGGYDAYTKLWSPSGKRRPPAGRWVSTGKEALKSGLNIPGVAESYDEGGNLRTARYAEGLPPGETLI